MSKHSLLRRAVALLTAAAALLTSTAAPAVAQQERTAIDYLMTCVPYTETMGACMETTYWSDGTSTHRWYTYWGNWWI